MHQIQFMIPPMVTCFAMVWTVLAHGLSCRIGNARSPIRVFKRSDRLAH